LDHSNQLMFAGKFCLGKHGVGFCFQFDVIAHHFSFSSTGGAKPQMWFEPRGIDFTAIFYLEA
jgi:hypothetical protein